MKKDNSCTEKILVNSAKEFIELAKIAKKFQNIEIKMLLKLGEN